MLNSKKWDNFYNGEGGARNILQVAFPLILSTSSYTIMQFFDRKFLLIYSSESFQAAAPAGMLTFAVLSLFFGTASYCNTFIAQYSGAKQDTRVGASLWQGLYFISCAWVLFLLPCYFFSEKIFSIVGHGPEVTELEVKYFKVLIVGSWFFLANMVFSSFYSGRGKTWIVMWVRFLAMLLNIPLNYCMIFGHFGFTEMGIEGAAWATVISTASSTVIFAVLTFSNENNLKFRTCSNYKFDKELFLRLIKFGLPNGVHFLIDILGFTLFLVFVGRLGPLQLAATNSAWSLNSIIFMPLIGMAIAISTLVGQAIGKENIRLARRSTVNSFYMVFTYMLIVAILFFLFPRQVLWILLSGANDNNLAELMDLSVVLLRFVGFYSIFDGFFLVFVSATKAAGDTRYAMRVTFICSVLLLVIPTYIVTNIWPMPVSIAWSFLATYLIVMALIFFLRYKSGVWEKMKVIEDQDPITAS